MFPASSPSQAALVVICVLMELVRSCQGDRVTSCPSRCRCAHGETNCRELNLSSVPLKLPASTTSLRMSFNKIRKLTNSSLDACAPGTKRLYFDHNHIQRMEVATLWGLDELEVLHLQGNNLVSLPEDTFQGLSRLEHLDLHANALDTLQLQLLSPLTRLRTLNLRDNRLSVISSSPFLHLEQLTHLELAGNPLGRPGSAETGARQLFLGLSMLRKLDLARCELRSLPGELLLPLPELLTLDLADNSDMNLVEADALRELKNLRHVNLSGAGLRCDCRLLPFRDWLLNTRLSWNAVTAPRCASPTVLQGLIVSEVPEANFTCPRPPSPPKSKTFITRFHVPSVVNPAPLPYDRMMGWYTAATLSTMLVLFLIGVALDKAKRRFFRWRRAKRAERERMRIENKIELLGGTGGGGPKPGTGNAASRDGQPRRGKLAASNSINSRDFSLPPPPPPPPGGPGAGPTANAASVTGGDCLTLVGVGRQGSCESQTRSDQEQLLKRNDLIAPRTPLPKVEIHLAPSLADFAKFHSATDYLKSQEILIDGLEKVESKLLLWPAHAKLNTLQKQVETSL